MTEPASGTAAAIRALQAAGVSIPEMARAVGRDPSYLRQIARGAKPGEALQGPLEQLRRVGMLGAPVPRRTAASGQPARVRAPRSAGVPSVVPVGPSVQPVEDVRTQLLAQGARVTHSNVPRRQPAAVSADLQRAVTAASRARQRLTFYVTLKDGRRATLGPADRGGYQAGDYKRTRSRGVLRQMRGHAGGPLGWLLGQLAAAGYTTLDGEPLRRTDLDTIEVSAYR